MKEYKSVYKVFEARAIAYGYGESARRVSLDQLDEEINKLAKDGWTVKFHDVTTYDIGTAGEPFVVFYVLLEREIE